MATKGCIDWKQMVDSMIRAGDNFGKLILSHDGLRKIDLNEPIQYENEHWTLA